MNNPLISRLMGESSDVVPVLANRTRASYRDRARTPRPDNAADDSVKRLVGEAEEKEGVIPDDATEMDGSETSVGKPLRPVRDVVQEPSHPVDKEKYQTPLAALTAPDVTPQATVPLDPSLVPGSGAPEKFTSAEMDAAAAQEPGQRPAPAAGMSNDAEHAERAMNILLGRNRTSAPPKNPQEFQQAGAITTEEAAMSALGIESPVIQENAKAFAASAVVPGGGMPAPSEAGDGSKIYSAFRRFAG